MPVKPLARENDTSSYRYNDEPVSVIVVFDEGDRKIAIIENSDGEQFDVPMDDLRPL